MFSDISLKIVAERNVICDSNAGINLTGYHPPPRADCWATNFFRQNPHPRDSFSAQNSGPRVKKNETKIPTPGHNLPCSNAKRSMKKEHNSIKAVSFQIFQFSIIVHLTIFFFRENKVFASLYTTLKINTV